MTKSRQTRQVRDIIGFTGIVLSLVFVGWEIRENTKVARGQTRVELTALNNEYLHRIASDTDLSEIWRRAWITGEQLTQSEEFRVRLILQQFLRLLENVHLQYQEGLIDENALNSYGFFGFREQFMDHPRFREIWEPRLATYDPNFVEYLESEE